MRKAHRCVYQKCNAYVGSNYPGGTCDSIFFQMFDRNLIDQTFTGTFCSKLDVTCWRNGRYFWPYMWSRKRYGSIQVNWSWIIPAHTFTTFSDLISVWTCHGSHMTVVLINCKWDCEGLHFIHFKESSLLWFVVSYPTSRLAWIGRFTWIEGVVSFAKYYYPVLQWLIVLSYLI